MNSKRNSDEDTVLSQLALDGYILRLRELMVPADSLSWSRFFGALLLVLVALLVFSGMFMAFYYSPVPGAAYDSVDFALYNLPFGDIVRGIHHYSWNFLLLVLGLHMLRGFIVGAYKAPRQWVWVSGAVIFLFVPAFIITGDLLPWDQKGYWSTQVRISIINSIPFLGDLMVRLLQGGSMTGIVALTRFYALHVIILPGLMFVLIAVHFHFIRHRGISEPLFGNTYDKKQIPFLPNLVNRWLLLFLIVTIGLGIVARYWTTPLGDPADPTDSSYIPRPEWWVLFLNQLVSIFKGSATVIGTALIPGVLAFLLIILPFLDRGLDRDPSRRLTVMIPAAIILVFLIGLSVMGYIEHFISEIH